MEIKNFRVVELSLADQKEVNGGSLIGSLLTLVIEKVIEDWDNFKNGLLGKPETPNK